MLEKSDHAQQGVNRTDGAEGLARGFAMHSSCIGYHGRLRPISLETLEIGRTGFWLSEGDGWARGYAERKAARTGKSPRLYAVSYALGHPLELGDVEEPATDDSLMELANGSGIPFETLCALRRAAGYTGKALDEPCVFEITNTPEFADLARARGFDGMIGWENGDTERVVSVFEKKGIFSVREIASEIPRGWWRGLVRDAERGACQSA